MKRGLFILLVFQLSILNFQFTHAQWWEAWSEKAGLVLCLHRTDNSFELYSPLQTTDPIPISKWSHQNDTLRLECSSIGFKATLKQKDSLWVGDWRQGIMREAITFHPSDTLYQLRRPQTPQPPYRFNEETVSVDFTDSQGNTVHLEGTLTYPKSRNVANNNNHSTVRFPCLVLVSGSGQQNRDEEIMQHKPFLVLADYLASHGIAVLRYDDRGMGSSTGALDNATTSLFSEDAEALFNAIRNNPHIDTNRLGIGGHSEGGAIAPLVASRNNKVKFVVMLAGQGCPGWEILRQQGAALLHTAGVNENLITIRQKCMDSLWTAVKGSGEKITQKQIQGIIKAHTNNLTQEEVNSIGLGRGAAYTLMQQLSSPWMIYFHSELSPDGYLPKVTCPVLALNGSKDLQVLPHPNLDRIKQLCPQADCRELPGLNHLFQHCTDGSPNEYMMIEETFSPEAMKAIADWILALP